MTTKQEKATTGTSEGGKYPIPSPALKPFWEISGLTSDDVSEAMGTVTFGVSSLEETNERAKGALAGEAQGARIDFPSAERLFTVMTSERWELVRRMAGAGALTVEQLARRLDRNPDDVYADVRDLLDCGVLYSTEDRRIIFPFKAVHIDVTLEAAA